MGKTQSTAKNKSRRKEEDQEKVSKQSVEETSLDSTMGGIFGL